MTAFAYYNEFDNFAADTLEELIRRGHIAPGFVDRRSILEVRADDLRGFCQAHFFAGVGVWSLAARRAGIPDDWPIWSGSAPCQPWSAAGKGKGADDERHLWPHWFENIIKECGPGVIFGEQVADASVLGKSVRSAGGGPDGTPRAWFDIISDDLESAHYAVGAVPFTSALCGAPHIRDRLYWVADAGGEGPHACAQPGIHSGEGGAGSWDGEPERSGTTDRMDDTRRAGLEGQRGGHIDAVGYGPGAVRPVAEAGGAGRLADTQDGDRRGQLEQGSAGIGRVADTKHDGQWQHGVGLGGTPGAGQSGEQERQRVRDAAAYGDPAYRTGAPHSPWDAPDWLWCRDGKWRPVEPGSKPLAHGLARGMGALDAGLAGLADVAGLDGSSLKRAKAYRVGALRAYGNAINAYQAEQFIRSWLAVRGR